MNLIPRFGAHGTVTCKCIEGDDVIVVDRTDEALILRFDREEAIWSLGWPAYLSGRFVKFEETDLEPAAWLR